MFIAFFDFSLCFSRYLLEAILGSVPATISHLKNVSKSLGARKQQSFKMAEPGNIDVAESSSSKKAVYF